MGNTQRLLFDRGATARAKGIGTELRDRLLHIPAEIADPTTFDLQAVNYYYTIRRAIIEFERIRANLRYQFGDDLICARGILDAMWHSPFSGKIIVNGVARDTEDIFRKAEGLMSKFVIGQHNQVRITDLPRFPRSTPDAAIDVDKLIAEMTRENACVTFAHIIPAMAKKFGRNNGLVKLLDIIQAHFGMCGCTVNGGDGSYEIWTPRNICVIVILVILAIYILFTQREQLTETLKNAIDVVS